MPVERRLASKGLGIRSGSPAIRTLSVPEMSGINNILIDPVTSIWATCSHPQQDLSRKQHCVGYSGSYPPLTEERDPQRAAPPPPDPGFGANAELPAWQQGRVNSESHSGRRGRALPRSGPRAACPVPWFPERLDSAI